MYCYIYDEFVQGRKHERTIAQIENRITDLGLQGKVIRLALFNNAEDAIRREVNAGVKTIVVVGNDSTVHKVLNAVVDTHATLAIIPVGESNILAQILGVPAGVAACDTLSQRIIEKIDVGRINNWRFLTGVSFANAWAAINYENQYNILMMKKGNIEVRNLAVFAPETPEEVSNPTDGKLEIVIKTQIKKRFRKSEAVTKIALQEFQLDFEKPVKAIADGTEIQVQNCHFSVYKNALETVVGKERMFNK